MKTKKDKNYSFEHTKQRLKERYDINIELKHYENMCEQILSKKDIKVIEIEYKKNDIQTIYDLFFP